jgi:hypothetical protein
MKTKALQSLMFATILLLSAALHAQSYTLGWSKIAGGGGASAGTNSGSIYSVSGTIGQPDAGGALTGGSYSVTGGFWSLLSVVQTAGRPSLSIARSGNSVIVSWPNTGTYTLQQNSNLATTNWTPSASSITTANGTNSINITLPSGSLFFRLAKP